MDKNTILKKIAKCNCSEEHLTPFCFSISILLDKELWLFLGRSLRKSLQRDYSLELEEPNNSGEFKKNNLRSAGYTSNGIKGNLLEKRRNIWICSKNRGAAACCPRYSWRQRRSKARLVFDEVRAVPGNWAGRRDFPPKVVQILTIFWLQKVSFPGSRECKVPNRGMATLIPASQKVPNATPRAACSPTFGDSSSSLPQRSFIGISHKKTPNGLIITNLC